MVVGSHSIFLSYLVTENSPRYGGKGIVSLPRTREISKGHTSNNSELHLAAHLGTHIDAPFHFDNNGKTVDSYPPDFWICKHPFLINYTAKPAEVIELDILLDQLEEIPSLCDFLLLNTQFSRFRNDNVETYIFNNPGISPEIGTWLRKNTSVKMIGFDFISLSSYPQRELGRKAHKAFLSTLEINGEEIDPILIVEDMNLSKLEICPSKIIVSPLRYEMADGSPVTVFGINE